MLSSTLFGGIKEVNWLQLKSKKTVEFSRSIASLIYFVICFLLLSLIHRCVAFDLHAL